MTLLVLLLLQGTREAPFGESSVVVRVPVSTPGEHRATVVTFPEKSLESLVAGWGEQDLSVERRGANLFIKLLRPAEGDLHVLGSSGRLYRLALRSAEGAYDGRVLIRLPRERSRDLPPSLELIRTMRRNRRPREGSVFRADRPLHVDPSMAATLVRIYEVPRFRGFVVRIRNRSDRPRRIQPDRFISRDLVLVGARELVLEPNAETYVYLIFGKRA